MGGTLYSGVIEGREAFTEALRGVLCALPESGARDVWLVGEDFDAWPLDDTAVLDALGRWTRPSGHRLHMVGGDFNAVQRRFPRFSAWRRDRSHAFEAWQPAAAERAVMGTWLLAGDQAVELLDAEHWRARQVNEPAASRASAEKVAALLHRCEPGWPVTTLGL